MQYTVVIQRLRNGGYSASVPALPTCRSRAATEKEVLAKIHTAISAQLQRTKIVQLEVKTNGKAVPNPWNAIIGMFENDPIFDEVEREMKKTRKRSKFQNSK